MVRILRQTAIQVIPYPCRLSVLTLNALPAFQDNYFWALASDCVQAFAELRA